MAFFRFGFSYSSLSPNGGYASLVHLLIVIAAMRQAKGVFPKCEIVCLLVQGLCSKVKGIVYCPGSELTLQFAQRDKNFP